MWDYCLDQTGADYSKEPQPSNTTVKNEKGQRLVHNDKK